tara:strand:+ start:541 stop:765 length:225 start_codon:yes stop_codon:yes gene_type:complete
LIVKDPSWSQFLHCGAHKGPQRGPAKPPEGLERPKEDMKKEQEAVMAISILMPRVREVLGVRWWGNRPQRAKAL